MAVLIRAFFGGILAYAAFAAFFMVLGNYFGFAAYHLNLAVFFYAQGLLDPSTIREIILAAVFMLFVLAVRKVGRIFSV